MGSFPGERTSSEFEREELLLRKEYTDREHLISAFTEIKGLRDAEEVKARRKYLYLKYNKMIFAVL